MKFVVRAAKEEDLEGLYDLATQFSLLNLPADKQSIKKIIATSIRSFAGDLIRSKSQYLLVLEDLESQWIVGSSQVIGQCGTDNNPNYSFKVMKRERFCKDLGIGFIHQVLRLKAETDGPSEVGGLIINKSYRSRPERLGRFLSLSRFMYVGMYLDKFGSSLHAEMAPPLTNEGRSEFWEALGRRFTGMPYKEADQMTHQNKEFIKNLFPTEDIYLCLLDSKARLVLGRVADSAQPALHMLSRLGFVYNDEVDPFDGGPHLGVKTSEVSLIKTALKLEIKVSKTPEFAGEGLVAIDREGEFLCGSTAYRRDGGFLELPEMVRKALALEAGEMVYFSEGIFKTSHPA